MTAKRHYKTSDAKLFSPDKTLRQVASELGRTYESVYKHAYDNGLPFKRRGKRADNQRQGEELSHG